MSPSNCHAGAVIGLALSPPKESLLAATDSEGGLKIWNMVTRDVQTNWRGNPDASRRPVFSSDGRLVLHVSNDGLRFHQTVAGAAPSLAMDAGQASRAALSGDGRVLGLRYEDGRLEIRRLDRLNDITAALPGNNPDGSLALTPDGRILLSFTPNGVVAWEWPHPELRRFDRCVFATAAFSSDSKSFVGLSPPRTIHRIRLPMLDIERTVELRGSASLVTALALVDDQTLACGERSGHIFLLDLQTGKERRRLLSGHDGVASLAVSPDGRRLASGGFSGDLAVWDLDSLLNEPRR
jgi:WD40 repeat protein